MASFLFRTCCLLALATTPAMAQTVSQTIIGGGQVHFNDDQRLMLEAAGKVMGQDWRAAEGLYSQAIALNGANAEAHLQRAVVRGQLGNEAGKQDDARTAITLTNQALRQNNNDPFLYYRRGMAYRLLKDFTHAKEDIRTAIRLGGKSSWQTDLKAVELEEKAG